MMRKIQKYSFLNLTGSDCFQKFTSWQSDLFLTTSSIHCKLVFYLIIIIFMQFWLNDLNLLKDMRSGCGLMQNLGNYFLI